jgi:hypothetical protein
MQEGQGSAGKVIQAGRQAIEPMLVTPSPTANSPSFTDAAAPPWALNADYL